MSTPTQVGKVNGAFVSTWKLISAGDTHACAITGAGLLYCWGDNAQGELGFAKSNPTTTLTNSIASAEPWIAVSAGSTFSVGLQADGTAWSWGANGSGQLGTSSTAAYHSTPTQVVSSLGLPWVAVSAGAAHVLAIAADGSLWGWGSNDKGQLGSAPTTTGQNHPVAIGPAGSAWVAVSAGGHDSFAIRSDGQLFAWGDNGLGQLGCQAPSCSVTPGSLAAIGPNFQYIAAGYDFTLAVTANGDLWAWGNNASGQLGIGTSGGTVGAPFRVPGIANVSFGGIKPAVITGAGSTNTPTANGAQIKTSGTLETWGTEAGGALGLTSAQLSACDGTTCWWPVPVLNAEPFIQVAAGRGQTLAITSDGSLWGWGANLPNGKIGTATWLKVFASPYNTPLGIQANGTLWNLSSTPTAVCPAGSACANEHWAEASVGGYASLAVSNDGLLWGWGTGDGDREFLSCPQTSFPTVPRLLNQYGGSAWATNKTWLDAEASAQDTSAIDASGNLWAWGYDPYGQIGSGYIDTNSVGVPTPTKVLSNVVSACQSFESVMALDAQSNLFVWGHNESEQLGIHQTGSQGAWATNAFTGVPPGNPSSPIAAASLYWPGSGVVLPAMAIACGAHSTFVEDTYPETMVTGDDTYGELGVAGAFISPYPGYGSTLFPGNAAFPTSIIASPNPSQAAHIDSYASGSAGYWTSGGAQTGAAYVQLDLGATRYFSQLELDSGSTTNIPAQYQISVWNGSTWILVATGPGSAYLRISFPIQYARYVFIAQAGHSPNPWNVQAAYVEE